MEDYSFMKTGFTNVENSNQTNQVNDNLFNILELFTSNSIKNSARFVELCNRNGITAQDMKYGIIYEVFEFFNRNSNMDDLKIIEELQNNHDDSDDEQEYILPDDELEEFKKININDIENQDDKEFVEKLYNYYNNWDTWEPKTPIEKILKKSINKFYI